MTNRLDSFIVYLTRNAVEHGVAVEAFFGRPLTNGRDRRVGRTWAVRPGY